MTKRVQRASGFKAYALMAHARIIAVVGLLIALVLGCTDTQPMGVGASAGSLTAPAAAAPASASATDAAAASPQPGESAPSTADMQELEQLWQRRTAQVSSV